MRGKPFVRNDHHRAREGLKQLGVNAGEDQIGRLTAYLKHLEEWNRTFNLVRIARERWIERIILESAALITLVRDVAPGSRWADFGTGAGIPGLVLSILNPGITVYLFDSSSKKTDFNQYMVSVLKLENTVVLNERVEDTPSRHPGLKAGFTCIFARAFSSLRHAVGLALPLLAPRGQIILPKGGTAQREWVLFQEECGEFLDGEIARVLIPGGDKPLSCVRIHMRSGNERK